MARIAAIMNDKTPEPRRVFDDLRKGLAIYRSATGATQDDIAKMLGATRGQISAFERNINLPREEVLEKLIRLLRGPAVLLSDDLRNIADYLLADDIPERERIVYAMDRIERLKMLLNRIGIESGKIDD